MNFFGRIKLWYYRRVWGYIPAGHLVEFSPPLASLMEWPRDPRRDPEINGVGLSLGEWRAFKSPGFMDVGTTVLIDNRRYNLYTWDLVVLDESR
jgi:hypothetical protein